MIKDIDGKRETLKLVLE